MESAMVKEFKLLGVFGVGKGRISGPGDPWDLALPQGICQRRQIRRVVVQRQLGNFGCVERAPLSQRIHVSHFQ